METTDAVLALSGLAQETRLAIFRYLVQVGPEGESAGDLAERFQLPPATLSFHLSQLCQCGLLRAQRSGRRILYMADYDGMNRLMTFLTGCRQKEGSNSSGDTIDRTPASSGSSICAIAAWK